MLLNYSEACERNRAPILAVLKTWLTGPARVLEVGSGSGQHALYFGKHLPHLRWQPSEVAALLSVLTQNIRSSGQGGAANIESPLELDVLTADWGCSPFDAVYTANTLHIISVTAVEHFFRGAGQVLRPGGLLLVYGPFRYNNRYTSDSNARFDSWLRSRDPASGIRDFEQLNQLAEAGTMELRADVAMPANNQLLIWQKTADGDRSGIACTGNLPDSSG